MSKCHSKALTAPGIFTMTKYFFTVKNKKKTEGLVTGVNMFSEENDGVKPVTGLCVDDMFIYIS